jgi:hypothetical protein
MRRRMRPGQTARSATSMPAPRKCETLVGPTPTRRCMTIAAANMRSPRKKTKKVPGALNAASGSNASIPNRLHRNCGSVGGRIQRRTRAAAPRTLRVAVSGAAVRRKEKSVVKATIAVLVVFLLGSGTPGRITWTKRGEIRTLVIDRGNAPLAGVTVILSPSAPGSQERALVTNPAGKVSFHDLAPGDYLIKFQLSGFADMCIGPVTLRSSSRENPRLPEFLVMMNPVLEVD